MIDKQQLIGIFAKKAEIALNRDSRQFEEDPLKPFWSLDLGIKRIEFAEIALDSPEGISVIDIFSKLKNSSLRTI